MKERFAAKFPLIFLIAAVLGLGLSSASVALEREAGQAAASAGMRAAAGTYSAVMPLGGGFNFTVLFTLHADGTVTSQDITDFGAPSVAGGDGPHLNSPAVGSWKHTSERSIVATLIYFRSAVGGSGEVDGIGRLSLTGSFEAGFGTGTLDAIVENFSCVPATIGCTDPALLPPPTAPPFGTLTLLRIMPG